MSTVDRRRPHLGRARLPGGRATGLGGQPVVQPNGTVIVPVTTGNEIGIRAFRSTDGGELDSPPRSAT